MSWERKNAEFIHLHNISIRPAEPGKSLSEKSLDVDAL
jgi:hypothetical protein